MSALLAAAADSSSTAGISAGAGIVGALVGGLVSGYFNVRGERARRESAREATEEARDYEEKQRERRARGAARQWQQTLRSAETWYAIALEHGEWWPEELTPEGFPDVPERREVISLLSDTAWQAVSDAEATMELVKVRRLRVPDGTPDLAQGDREHVSTALPVVAAGAVALDSLAT